jgi:hypothetical protein
MGNTATFGTTTAGGDINLNQAEGDITYGDKITTQTITTGFKQEQDKQEFLKQIEELRGALRQIQTEMQNVAGLDQDAKDEIVTAIMQQVTALNKAKGEAEKLSPESPAAKHKTLEDYLESTETVLNKAKEIGGKAAEWTVKLAPYFEKALPLVLSARRLFGIP